MMIGAVAIFMLYTPSLVPSILAQGVQHKNFFKIKSLIIIFPLIQILMDGPVLKKKKKVRYKGALKPFEECCNGVALYMLVMPN